MADRRNPRAAVAGTDGPPARGLARLRRGQGSLVVSQSAAKSVDRRHLRDHADYLDLASVGKCLGRDALVPLPGEPSWVGRDPVHDFDDVLRQRAETVVAAGDGHR